MRRSPHHRVSTKVRRRIFGVVRGLLGLAVLAYIFSLVHAEAKGWRLRYLGADLPLNDAIEAAWRTRPSVLALSASDAANVAGRLEELTLLPGRLPPGVVPMIGGRGFTPHLSALEPAGFVHSGVDFPAPGSLAGPAARPR